jgi:predicted metalloendopeptidase
MAESPHAHAWQIQSEARGAHWVAWVSRPGTKPDRAVVVVGQTQEEAEAHARVWAEQQWLGQAG